MKHPFQAVITRVAVGAEVHSDGKVRLVEAIRPVRILWLSDEKLESVQRCGDLELAVDISAPVPRVCAVYLFRAPLTRRYCLVFTVQEVDMSAFMALLLFVFLLLRRLHRHHLCRRTLLVVKALFDIYIYIYIYIAPYS